MSRRRKILIVAGIVLGVAILIPVVRHYQLRFAVANYVAELKAKGEPMELAQVIPPSVPPEQNGVPLIINSLTNIENKYNSISETNPPPAMRMVAPGRAMIGWQQSDIRSSDGTNKWDDLGRELAAAKSDLASFQNLVNCPILDFTLDYEKGFAIQLRHLPQLKQAAQWLNASELYNLHEGRTSDACANLKAILAIAKGQTEERLEISQLVRLAIAHIGAAATWEILQDPKISESDLSSLQQNWQSLEFIEPVERAYLMERVMDLRSMKQFQQNPNDLWRGVSGGDGLARAWHENQWRWFWSDVDEKRALQTQSVLIEATRIAETNGSFLLVQSFVRTNFVKLKFEAPQSENETFRMDIDDFGVRWLFSDGAYDSFTLLRRAIIVETIRNAVVTAIALKRYELFHHQLPTTLAELTPDLLKSVPTDYMNGEPLRYRPNADGTFLLYSVGENGKDDGGDPSLEKGVTGSNFYWQNDHALDWVWPQPATSAEVKYFYEHPPKWKE